MSWFDGLRHRIRTLIAPDRHAEELAEEVTHHLELAAQQVEDASEARRRFGNRTIHREEARALTWIGRVDRLRQDLDYVRRSLIRDPGVTALIVATLALGVGVNAATFAVVDRLYLRLPGGVAEPGTLRRYWVEHIRTGDGVPFTSDALSYPMFRTIAAASRDSTQVAAYATDYSLRLGRGLSGPRVRAVYASPNYASVLGLRLEQGRFFSAAEGRLGQGADVAVVSHRFWLEHLGARGSVIGESIEIGPRRYHVIGVFEPRFTGLDLQSADVWIPLASIPTPSWLKGAWWEGAQVHLVRAIERSARVASQAVVEARATAMIRQQARDADGGNADTLRTVYWSSFVGAPAPVKPGQEMVIASRLGGVALIVLLIAIANVINLILARSVERRREIAVRLALGVSRGRLIWLLILEVLGLAALAGVGAVVIGGIGGSLLRTLLLPNVAWADAAFDWRVGGFTAVIALISGLIAAVPTAIQASRPDLTSALKSGARNGGRERTGLRSGLVALQAALSVVLLVGAALFVGSLGRVEALDVGFELDRLIVASVDFAEGEAPPDPVISGGLQEARTWFEADPRVEAIGRSAIAPMWGFSSTQFYTESDSAGSFQPRVPTFTAVTPSYFDAVGLQLLKGHGLTGHDTDGNRPEIVVNEAMAMLVWRGEEPLGRCLRFGSRGAPCYTVVGVVENARLGYVIEPHPAPQFYLPLGALPPSAAPSDGWVILIRPKPGTGSTVAGDLQRWLADRFPGSAVTVDRMRDRLADEYRPWRLGASLFTGLGVLALAVALIGIYSSVSYGVKRRTHEFGIRMALGAKVTDVLLFVVGSGLRVVGLGVLLGISASVAAGGLVRALLYGVSPSDPLVLGKVSLALLMAAAGAAAIPAWRAARLDPVTALRDE